MATPEYFNSTQNFPKPYKKLKGHSRNSANWVSSWAFLFSIFIYISIFYIFNLSPSSVLNTTKFWFFISNTLILIIAVDSGAFSSSKEPQQIQVRAFSNSYELPNMELAKKKKNNNLLVKDDVDSQETIKEVVFVQKRENPKNKLGIVAINVTQKPNENSQKKVQGIPQNAHYQARDHQEKREEGIYFRSKSEKIMISSNEKKFNILRRSESENKREMIRREEGEDEFSSMSDEELNRRVEEFIQKFNRQIRLQALAGKLQ